MPIYQYLCQCGLEFEEVVSSVKSPNPKCLNCNSDTEKVPALTAGVRFEAGIPNKELDIAVGTSAEKRWQKAEQRHFKKREMVAAKGKDVITGGTGRVQKRNKMLDTLTDVAREYDSKS